MTNHPEDRPRGLLESGIPPTTFDGGQSKVPDFHRLFVQKNVAGLQIPMNNIFRVQIAEHYPGATDIDSAK